MAIDTQREGLLSDVRAGGKAIAERCGSLWSSVRPALSSAGSGVMWVIRRLPMVAWFSRSLVRRILLSNLFGLAILLAGYLYLNQYKDWLVDAKVDSLTAQGEIIAQAIAGNAKLVGERLIVDPDTLPASNESLVPFRDDGFAALAFSLGPERVTPILSRLLQPDVRARVYDRDGRLLVDSDDFLARGTVVDTKKQDTTTKVKTKNLWTKLTEYFFTAELQVLKDLGKANGRYYPPVRNAMEGTATPMLLLSRDGQQIVSYAAPIRRARQIYGVLLLSTEPGDIEKVLDKERNSIIRLAILAVAATIAASILLAYSVASPIRRLSAAAEAVSHNINARQQLPDFSERKDEVGMLAHAFAAMTRSLYRRIEASEKFAADVAHELKNPLTAARSTAESLAFAKTDQERDQLVRQIQDELKRLNRLITDVSNASRLDAELALQEREVIDLEVVLRGVVSTFQDILSETTHTVSLETRASSGGLVAYAHEGRIGQVITNLIDNAVSFSPENGKVWVRACRDGEMIKFAVEDEGPGIDPDMLEAVFKRFYTYRPTKESSRGTNSGLGLSISREIVLAHDGRIWAENRYEPGAAAGVRPLGARFVVQLPAASAEMRGSQVRGTARRGKRG
ncbi:MAG: stimulus-sensing domain-containing protein [Hyphomicrobiaceae bacterium]